MYPWPQIHCRIQGERLIFHFNSLATQSQPSKRRQVALCFHSEMMKWWQTSKYILSSTQGPLKLAWGTRPQFVNNTSCNTRGPFKLNRTAPLSQAPNQNCAASCLHVRNICAQLGGNPGRNVAGVTVICVSPWDVYPHTHITSDMCIPSKMAASDMCIPHPPSPLLEITISSLKAITSSGHLPDARKTQTD